MLYIYIYHIYIHTCYIYIYTQIYTDVLFSSYFFIVSWLLFPVLPLRSSLAFTLLAPEVGQQHCLHLVDPGNIYKKLIKNKIGDDSDNIKKYFNEWLINEDAWKIKNDTVVVKNLLDTYKKFTLAIL